MCYFSLVPDEADGHGQACEAQRARAAKDGLGAEKLEND